MVRGQLTASVNGRQYQVSAGDALIVQSGSVVESMMCSSDLKIIAMAFTDRHDVEYMQRSTSEVSSLIQHRAFPVTVHLEEEAMSNYIRLYRAVKGIYRFTEQRFRGDVVRGFLQISTSSFAGRIKEEFPSGENARGRANELYLDFMDDLQRFCTQERSVGFYAGRRCVCAKYFARQVKAVSGKSPGRIIRERVLIEGQGPAQLHGPLRPPDQRYPAFSQRILLLPLVQGVLRPYSHCFPQRQESIAGLDPQRHSFGSDESVLLFLCQSAEFKQTTSK